MFGTDQAATEDEVTTNQDEIAADQAHFDNAWEARERKRANLANAGAAAGGPSKTMAAVKRAGEQHAASLGNPDEAVAFGRFDRDGERYFIGYQLISSDDHDPLVINWKTRAAEPFYKATVQSALGLDRKRSYTTSRNKILDFSDTVFSQLADAVAELSGAEQWGIDDALLNDLESSRTGEMQDIVHADFPVPVQRHEGPAWIHCFIDDGEVEAVTFADCSPVVHCSSTQRVRTYANSRFTDCFKVNNGLKGVDIPPQEVVELHVRH